MTPQAQMIFKKQWLHITLLAALLAGMTLVTSYEEVRAGQLWGIATLGWLWLAIGIAVAHQIYVWLCWRIQLHASWITNTFGKRGFTFYAVGFAILGISRVAIVPIVAISNHDTLSANPLALKTLAVILLVPAAYLFYSVKQYFGFKRAFGVDHFDTDYRTIRFEGRGIFRFSNNGMYVYGFFLFWVPGFWWASLAALSVAMFNHLYIWVHYYATELPDIKHIYGESGSNGQSDIA